MKTIVVCFVTGICICQQISAQEIVQYGSFKFEERKNDLQSIETEIVSLLQSEYPNIQKSGEFDPIFSTHTEIVGLPATKDVYGMKTPTEITAISFDKDLLSDTQVARESFTILNNLISEHGYSYPKESYTGYRVKTINDGMKIKVCLFVNAEN